MILLLPAKARAKTHGLWRHRRWTRTTSAACSRPCNAPTPCSLTWHARWRPAEARPLPGACTEHHARSAQEHTGLRWPSACDAACPQRAAQRLQPSASQALSRTRVAFSIIARPQRRSRRGRARGCTARGPSARRPGERRQHRSPRIASHRGDVRLLHRRSDPGAYLLWAPVCSCWTT